MKILVTGGAGFIGSNFVRYVLKTYPDDQIVNLDKLTYAGNLENLAGLEDQKRYAFVRSDIGAEVEVDAALSAGDFDAIVNFAAETHVDRSLQDAQVFVQTNSMGTQVLLDACRRHKIPRYLQVSTDEVYGSLGPEGKFVETTPLAPNNPYSASKAAGDCLVRAAVGSHGVDAVITRCSNNFGPYQFPEKLIPLMIANCLEDKELPVYGDGMHVRDWIYVEDHCSGIDAALRKGVAGEVYNIGGNYDVPNLEIVKTILRVLDKPESLIRFVKDRPGHDRRYAIDSSKIESQLGWKPSHTFEDAMRSTVDWYLGNRDWIEHTRSGEYQTYYERMYGNR
ncbi:MAG: dTDP-glucose 4,6-dehydratase [Verrucomicrobia bacterium]|nr:dTDP-glucose 4,6-dehydratase [Verrucomicrobiota bacterium]MDA1085955.1 dTDP-glucose 4,6-dehydratase [Verrucomicrobiota bacterium]